MCFCMYFLTAYTIRHMKKNITILIGIVVLIAVLYGAQKLMNNREHAGVSDLPNKVLIVL